MAFENPYLADFAPIFFSIIKEKDVNPSKLILVIFDEEVGERHVFERVGIMDVLNQLREKLNALKIYTDRPEFFMGFVEHTYEETGLLTDVSAKKEQRRVGYGQPNGSYILILDFERRGVCYDFAGTFRGGYIPIYKKPWEMGGNLDIIVPFGYNTVIVKGKYTNDRKFIRDRFDEGFYRDE